MVLAVRLIVGLMAILSLPVSGDIDSPISPALVNEQPERRNILLVIADDLGFSDLGAFGGEIETPNLDLLAMQGTRFAAFYTAPTCSPTRAMLLSGVDHHRAGLGNMAELMAENQSGREGYEGYLNDRVVSVAKILADSGYHTYISGKWHLGLTEETSPSARGFERSFVLLNGGAAHFEDTGLFASTPEAIFRENRQLTSWPKGEYSTEFYTDKLIQYLKDDQDTGRPFFAMLSFTAPHWPLQAPDEIIEKYIDHYTQGWEVLRERRIQGSSKVGFPTSGIAFVTPPSFVAWETLTLEQQAREARIMAVYAAMVDSIDQNIGRLIETLERMGKLENTVILFMSDNGPEGADLSRSHLLEGWLENFDNTLENIGRPGSYIFYGPNWAHATSAPLRLFKSFTSEGGIRVPAFIWSANRKRAGDIYAHPIFVTDVAPTFVDLAGLDPVAVVPHAKREYAFEGHSFAPLFQEESVRQDVDRIFAWEVFGRKAVRQGRWKALQLEPPAGSGSWELFDIESDPGETIDVAELRPDILAALVRAWRDYADRNKVILPEGVSGY